MTKGMLERRVVELTGDAALRSNALALISALEGTGFEASKCEDISLNPYTKAICCDWQLSGEWDSVEVQIYADRFETYLSRDRELRINHWPCEAQSVALEKVLGELLAGSA